MCPVAYICISDNLDDFARIRLLVFGLEKTTDNDLGQSISKPWLMSRWKPSTYVLLTDSSKHGTDADGVVRVKLDVEEF